MLIVLGILLLCPAVFIGRYLYNNLHYDEALMREVRRAGFAEKQVRLPDGSVINYGEGPDSGPALMLIHGQTTAWEDYDKVLPELSKHFHVYAVDCYGHGGSSHRTDLYSCKANGDALIWFMEHVIKKSCCLSGHSSGGILAAWLAANAPGRVAGLVLEDPPLFHVTPEEIQAGAGAFAWYDAYLVTHGFFEQQEETDFPLYYLKHSYLLGLFGGLREKIVRAAEKAKRPIQIAWIPRTWLRPLLYMDQYDPWFGNSFYDGSWMGGLDQEHMLKSMRCPVIYIKADTQYGKDGVLYAANTDGDAERVTRSLGDCERVNLKSGHNIHFEHPDVFWAACKKLLTEK